MKSFILSILILFAAPIVKAEPVWYPLPVEAYKFGDMYPEPQHLLYAFDYGHALVYERLLLQRGQIQDPEAFEKKILADILSVLHNPPTVKVEEGSIAPNYVYTFPLTVSLFDWSHMLHQFVLDVLATSKDRGPKMVARVNEIYATYQRQKSVLITDQCKTMLFMDGHYFSKAFRRTYPSFNLLIWSYHWFQIKLYEALLKPSLLERDAAVKAVTDQFWALVSNLPDSAEFDMMPQTAKEAPTFAALFPRIPSAFDNNHMLHDIVSDILTSDKVQTKDIRAEAMRLARMDMDPEAFKDVNCPASSK